MNDVIVIAGPTASGKTKLAHLIAKNTGGQIIVADSMKVFREADIATSKPPAEYKKEIQYHLTDIINPSDRYNVGAFYRDSSEIIEKLHKKDILPVVVGGTSLYITKLIEGLADIPKIPVDMRRELEKISVEALYSKLKQIDPERAGQLHPNMKNRIVRALGVYQHTGKKMSELISTTKPLNYNYIVLGINWEREVLYERINKRVDKMIQAGLIEEAENLYEKYGPGASVFEGVGYKQLLGYLNKTSNLEETIDNIKQATRNYAKRQIIWWRNRKVVWLDGKKLKSGLNFEKK